MILLAILDGWGLNPGNDRKNAIDEADTPFMDMVATEFPGRSIFAHGEQVGLPKGQMGNSEVGHLNIGGGREIRPDLVVINDLVESGGFYENPVLLELIEKVKSGDGRIHVMGLLSDGGIHSHIRHLEALLRLADEKGPVTVFLHAYLDGRDTEPDVADKYVKQAQEMLDSHPRQYFRTVGGRSWGMDRDNNWSREKVHYDAIVRGIAEYHASSALEAVENASKRGETDEFVVPTVIDLPVGVDGRVLDGDGVIHFNFRADRAIQMTRALTEDGFKEFVVSDRPDIDMVTFSRYDEYLNVRVAFEGEILHDTLTEVLSKAGKKVLKVAETEKWAHVTKFFNGGDMDPLEGEDRILVQSPLDVRPHYDKKPEMSACEIADRLTERIKDGNYDLVVVNFANPDMVGHTGVFEAGVKAVETVDKCVKRVFDTVTAVGGLMIITADHGNAEEMTDAEGHPATKHSTNPVPFYVLDKDIKLRDGDGALRDIAPTILDLMGIARPEAMSGSSLLAPD